MPYDIRANGKFSEINEWLHKNIGKPMKYPNKTNQQHWQIIPYGNLENQYVIRLFEYDMVLLTKLRWE